MHETSYGIIPLRQQVGEWQVLLIQHRNGEHWAFPKGHAEPNELPQQTAIRELQEETGLTVVRFLIGQPLKEKYSFMRGDQQIHKEVHYYLAEVEGKVTLQSKEILASRWVPLSEASQLITFPEGRAICKRVIAWLGEGRNHL